MDAQLTLIPVPQKGPGHLPFPIPYQGSKRKLGPAILKCFPSNVATLYEPFCGSAAITITALANGAANNAVIGDSNEPLIGLWTEIVNRPDKIAAKYRELWTEQLGKEREFYDLVRNEFNQSHKPGHLLYLLARCVKAAVRYNANGEFNQSPDNRRRGSHPDRMSDHIQRASCLMSGNVSPVCGDYRGVAEAACEGDLVYMDPPYQGVSTNRDRRYRDTLDFDDFVQALLVLNRRGVSYIISYDGRTGDKTHGKTLPATLNLGHVEIDAGRSTQATLLGLTHRTVESLYLSPALLDRIKGIPTDLA